MSDDADTPTDPAPGDGSRWRPRDAWLGLLFLASGAALLLLATGDQSHWLLWGLPLAWLLGPLLLLLGAHALWRSLRAAGRR